MLKQQQIDLFNSYLAEMWTNGSLDSALKLAKELLVNLASSNESINLEEIQDQATLDVVGLGNSKMDSWFSPHPYLGGHYIAFQLLDSPNSLLEAKFYQLGQTVNKRIIAGAVHLTPNWEDDRVLTRTGDWRVGIDFILTQDGKSLFMVLSNEYNLRVIELSERLSSTQVGILEKISGAGDLSTHEAIHSTLWDAFAIREVNKDFYQGVSSLFFELLNHLVSSGKNEADSKLFASRLIGRLLFVWFLRKKELIKETPEYFDLGELESTQYYERKLKQLFFAILNVPVTDRLSSKDHSTPYLNGGLFEAHENDWPAEVVSFPDGFFERTYSHFARFNFTTDESSPDYEQVAIDPEMLGRVFESLLATQRSETGDSARKSRGTFYTPREVVAYMCKESLREYLFAKLNNPAWNAGIDKLLDSNDAYVVKQHSNFKRDLWGAENVKVVVPKVQAAIEELRIIDPACGSGAFPMGMVQLITKILERLDSRLDPYKTKLEVIKNSIFGVDIEPMAIEIAKLRTWLALAVDEIGERRIDPLPNLDFKFVCANSLISLASEHDGLDFGVDEQLAEKLSGVRDAFFSTSSPTAKKKLQTEYQKLTQPSFISEVDLRTRQLNSFDPFKFSAPSSYFDPSQMFGVSEFDIVIGNPPYIGEKGNKSTFDAFKGSSLYNRFYQGRADLLHYFIHLGIDLLADQGILVYITTNYFPTATYGSTLRKDIAARTQILKLINFNEQKVFESALGQHNLISVLKKTKNNDSYACKQVIAEGNGAIDHNQLNALLADRSTIARSGQLDVNELFDGPEKYIRFLSGNAPLEMALTKISKAPASLSKIPGLSINQGILSGIDKFSRRWQEEFPQISAVPGQGIFIFKKGEQVFSNLKPWFKSSDIHSFVVARDASWEILYLGPGTSPTEEETNYLSTFREILESRHEFNTTLQSPRPWYQLHRARDKKIFDGAKIVASYRTQINAFAYSEDAFFAGADVTLITKSEDSEINLFFLLGLLNSQAAYSWFYHRGKRKGEMLELKAVPVSEFPVYRNAHIEQRIATFSHQIHEALMVDKDAEVDDLKAQVNELVFELYNLNPEERKAIENDYSRILKFTPIISSVEDIEDAELAEEI